MNWYMAQSGLAAIVLASARTPRGPKLKSYVTTDHGDECGIKAQDTNPLTTPHTAGQHMISVDLLAEEGLNSDESSSRKYQIS